MFFIFENHLKNEQRQRAQNRKSVFLYMRIIFYMCTYIFYLLIHKKVILLNIAALCKIRGIIYINQSFAQQGAMFNIAPQIAPFLKHCALL